VRREPDQQVRVHVDARHGARVVVQDEGQGARVGDLDEVVVHGLLVHEEAEVGWREDEGVVGADVLGLLAQLDRAPDAALGGADDDGRLGEAGGVERFS